ncbi:hypothetical protein AGDE_16282 [Angomonas deanei]|uniref:Uncharacterized protein n=1 Tax=Angomonas deanei TaxID=59799 RepID=A0A7G2C4X1_9TRYP|nr:hypothetical protein AGDE_16282 [Angomonas deanei]CAD2213797.1 hypothetical protein, conserved [Angomonas deanei]|eukprot:EPY17379.1 hypothetical protein AGDE_16282 [Angomonas deanei]
MAGMVSVEVRPPRTPTTGTKFHLPPHETQRPDPALTESAHPAMQRESAGPLTFAKPVSWQLGKQLTSFHLAITKKRRNAQGMARAARHDPTYHVGRLRLEAEDQRARNGVSPNNKTARLTLSDKVVCRSDPAPALPERVRAGSLCFWPGPSFPHGEFGPGLSSFQVWKKQIRRRRTTSRSLSAGPLPTKRTHPVRAGTIRSWHGARSREAGSGAGSSPPLRFFFYWRAGYSRRRISTTDHSSSLCFCG